MSVVTYNKSVADRTAMYVCMYVCMYVYYHERFGGGFSAETVITVTISPPVSSIITIPTQSNTHTVTLQHR